MRHPPTVNDVVAGVPHDAADDAHLQRKLSPPNGHTSLPLHDPRATEHLLATIAAASRLLTGALAAPSAEHFPAGTWQHAAVVTVTDARYRSALYTLSRALELERAGAEEARQAAAEAAALSLDHVLASQCASDAAPQWGELGAISAAVRLCCVVRADWLSTSLVVAEHGGFRAPVACAHATRSASAAAAVLARSAVLSTPAADLVKNAAVALVTHALPAIRVRAHAAGAACCASHARQSPYIARAGVATGSTVSTGRWPRGMVACAALTLTRPHPRRLACTPRCSPKSKPR